MEELGLQGGDSAVQPNSRTYCAVLDTLAKSKNYKAHSKSLEILERMHGEVSYLIRPCKIPLMILVTESLLCIERVLLQRLRFSKTLCTGLLHSFVHHCAKP